MKAELVGAGNRFDHRLGQLDRGLAHHQGAASLLDLPAHRRQLGRVGVSQQQRAGAHQVVDVLVAAHVADAGPASARRHHRVGRVGGGVADARRQVAGRLLEQLPLASAAWPALELPGHQERAFSGSMPK